MPLAHKKLRNWAFPHSGGGTSLPPVPKPEIALGSQVYVSDFLLSVINSSGLERSSDSAHLHPIMHTPKTRLVVEVTPAIPSLRRLRQEDHEFQANLSCIVSSRPARFYNETLSKILIKQMKILLIKEL